MIQQATELSRAGLRTRREQLVTNARPILHSAVAAALAWLIATEVVGHQRPFFAPVSAVVTLGLTSGERRRRAVELGLGVTVGIAIADLLVAGIGTGTWQVAVVVALAMTAATLVGGGPLLASQAATSGVLVATLQPPNGGVDFSRALDALVGSSTALVVSSLLLPVNPLRLLRAAAAPVLDRLSEALELIAEALRTRSREAADEALRTVTLAGAAQADLQRMLQAAGEAARLSPQRRGALGDLDRYAVAAGQLGRVVENLRALGRGVVRAIDLGDSVPPEAIEAVEQLRAATERMPGYLGAGDPQPARTAAVQAAALANSVLEATSNLSAVHIVGQIRLAAADLLRATGLTRSEAQEAVRGAQLSSTGMAPLT